MGFIKYFNILLGIIILTGCGNHIKLSTSALPSQNYLAVASGIAPTIEEARAQAISLLSQNIFVSVKSNFYSIDKLNNTNYSTETINHIFIDSTGFFKNLTFSQPTEIKKNKYIISVGFTAQSLITTINYLKDNLNITIIDSLNPTDLQYKYNKISFLVALILYAQNHNIPLKNLNYNDILNYKNNLTLRLSDAAQVRFNIIPNLTKTIKMNIINKDYDISQLIFLAPGTYYYTIYTKGYKPVTQQVTVAAKDKLTIDVYLQRLLNNPINIKLDVVFNNIKLEHSLPAAQIASLVEKYQLKINNFTSNTLSIHFLSPTSHKLDNYYYFNLPVNISLVKNNNIKLTQVFNIPYVSQNKEGYINPHAILEKLDIFLSNITCGDNLNISFNN